MDVDDKKDPKIGYEIDFTHDKMDPKINNEI